MMKKLFLLMGFMLILSGCIGTKIIIKDSENITISTSSNSSDSMTVDKELELSPDINAEIPAEVIK